MLFLKTEGSSLSLEDWMRQLHSDVSQQEVDLLAESAIGLWQSLACGGLGIPVSRAIRTIQPIIGFEC
jgi:hypothetical protein